MDDDFIKEYYCEWTEETCTSHVHKITEVMAKYNSDLLIPKSNSNQYKTFTRDDSQLCLPFFFELNEINTQALNISNHALKAYVQDYPSLIKCYDQLSNSVIKYQKTLKNGGYHAFHVEHSGNNINKKRVLSWILYLNTLNSEGGETEFLHFNRRIKPISGKLIIFPATWPWVHRGNPPRETKHILTGWFYHDILSDPIQLSELI